MSALSRPNSPVSILIVDDHPMVRDSLAALARELVPQGNVIAAATLEEALTHLQTVPACNLVCLDLGLPGHAGLSALWTLREAAPDIAIAVFSASDDTDTMRRALACGARGFIPKHSHATVVAHALRLILDGGAYVPIEALATVRTVERRAAASSTASRYGWDGRERRAAAPSQSESAIQSAIAGMAPRSREVVTLLGKGLSNKEIARQLNVSLNTVKTHVAHVFETLGVHTRRDIYNFFSARASRFPTADSRSLGPQSVPPPARGPWQ
jgi:DNA-binding NarL/FixJ family response regulator